MVGVRGAWEIYKFGAATKTEEKRSLARERHDVGLRLGAKRAMKYPAVRFDEAQRIAIGEGFSAAVAESGYRVYACCVGHDHVHLVIGRHARSIERVGAHLKSKATMALTRRGIHPLWAYRNTTGSIPRPWSDGVWSVFIEDLAQLNSAIGYVRRHPEKEGLPAQVWGFMVQGGGA